MAVARVLKALAEECWSDPQGVGGLRSGQVENLADDVRQPVWPVQALQHAERASNLHFLGQQRSLGVRGPVRREAFGEIVGEAFKGQVQALDGALLHVEDVVDGDPVDPRLELAAKVELRQPSDCANQDLLRRVLRILSIPEHAQGKAVDIALQISDELFDGVPVAVERPSGDVFKRHRLVITFHQRFQRRKLGSQSCALCLERAFDLFERYWRRMQDEAVDTGATSGLGHP